MLNQLSGQLLKWKCVDCDECVGLTYNTIAIGKQRRFHDMPLELFEYIDFKDNQICSKHIRCNIIFHKQCINCIHYAMQTSERCISLCSFLKVGTYFSKGAFHTQASQPHSKGLVVLRDGNQHRISPGPNQRRPSPIRYQ
jgi:hypothetical protein